MSFIAAAIIGAGALSAGAGVYSAVSGSDAAKSAAQAQLQAAQGAQNTQLSMFNQTQANLAPYNQMGQSALSQLAGLFGLGGNTATPGGPASLFGFGAGGPNNQTAGSSLSALQNYPGYQFGLQQGGQALDRSAASRGLLLSGAQLQDSQQFGQGYAQQQGWQPYVSSLQNYTSNLSGLAGLGENAAATAGNQGVMSGQGIASSQLAAGQAQASGIVGSANAINGGINSGIAGGLNSSLLAYQLSGGGGQPGYGSSGNSFSPYNVNNGYVPNVNGGGIVAGG